MSKKHDDGSSPDLVPYRPSFQDCIAERQKQLNHWDDENVHRGYNLDGYIALALTYLGMATSSYRNDGMDEKRSSLIKAAALILQAVDRIDDQTLDHTGNQYDEFTDEDARYERD